MTSWILKPIQATGCTESHPLTAEGLSLGRAEGNSIVLSGEAFPQVSGNHAELSIVGGMPVIVDCGSSNGTLVNGRRVERQVLSAGDVIQLGTEGPRFAMANAGVSLDTIRIQLPKNATAMSMPDLTQSGVIRVKESLGLAKDQNISEMIAQRSSKASRSLWIALVLIGSAIATGYLLFENARQQEFQTSTDAVVLLDVNTFILDPTFGKTLVESSCGSGFAIGDDGWIVTNAHVVQPSRAHDGRSTDVFVIEVEVVFNGQTERHPAKVVNAKLDEDQYEDLALLKIVPFEGMPNIADVDTGAGPVPTGAQVFACGFHLGKAVVQGTSAQASITSGVISRNIDDRLLQVDAAVHPGASGGPVVDARGRVLGVVKGVQTMSDGTYASDISYVIPVSRLASIWPPPR